MMLIHNLKIHIFLPSHSSNPLKKNFLLLLDDTKIHTFDSSPLYFDALKHLQLSSEHHE